MKRFGHLVKYDFKYGIVSHWGSYLIMLFVSIILGILNCGISRDGATTFNVMFQDYTFGVFGGCLPYVYNPQEPIELPYAWIIAFALISYFVLNYTKEECKKFGAKLLVLSGTRYAWWFSKCIWLSISIAGFYLVFVFAAVVVSAVFGSDALGIRAGHLFQYANSESLRNGNQDGVTFFLVFVTGYFAMLCVGLIQMILTTKFNAIAVYISTLLAIVLAIFTEQPVLLSNFMMMSRSELYSSGGFQATCSLVIVVGLFFVLAILGSRIFRDVDFC